MSADKYPSIFSRQMKAIVYLFMVAGSNYSVHGKNLRLLAKLPSASYL